MQENSALVANWVQSKELTYPVLLDNSGNVWKQYGQGWIPHNVVLDQNLVVQYTDYGYDSLSIKQHIEALLSPSGVDEHTGLIRADGFSLDQNYPNPFNGETVITFQIPSDTHVKLTIYNLTGQEIVTLYNGLAGKGRHRFTWNGADVNGKQLPSGIYLYRLYTDEFNNTLKLTYLR